MEGYKPYLPAFEITIFANAEYELLTESTVSNADYADISVDSIYCHHLINYSCDRKLNVEFVDLSTY